MCLSVWLNKQKGEINIRAGNQRLLQFSPVANLEQMPGSRCQQWGGVCGEDRVTQSLRYPLSCVDCRIALLANTAKKSKHSVQTKKIKLCRDDSVDIKTQNIQNSELWIPASDWHADSNSNYFPRWDRSCDWCRQTHLWLGQHPKTSLCPWTYDECTGAGSSLSSGGVKRIWKKAIVWGKKRLGLYKKEGGEIYFKNNTLDADGPLFTIWLCWFNFDVLITKVLLLRKQQASDLIFGNYK